MPQRSDMLPPTPASLWQDLKALRREFNEFRAARRLEAAAIGAGGITITDGGYLKVLDTDGSIQFWVGGISPANPDGSPQRGLIAARDDGSQAIVLARLTGNATDPQGLLIRDAQASTLFAEDVIAGGLARPYLSSDAWFGGTETPAYTTTSGTFTTLQTLPWVKQHPRVTGHYLVQTGAGTTGELRLVDDSNTAIGPIISIGAAAFFYSSTTGSLSGRNGLETYLHWQARTTGGAGSIGVRGLCTFGVQS
jgi:hypothetical protein